MVPLISLIAWTDSWVPLDAADLLADLAGGFRSLLGRAFTSDATTANRGRPPGAGRLDGGIQRQQIGLSAMVLISSTTSPMRGRRLRQLADTVVVFCAPGRPPHWHPRRILYLRLISLTDEDISSVAEATDCTLGRLPRSRCDHRGSSGARSRSGQRSGGCFQLVEPRRRFR